MDQEFDGKGLTPYDPAHNSTYLLAGKKNLSWETLFLTYIIIFSDGELYTATVSDFSGSDPLIYKEPLRTEQYDSKILNSKLDKMTNFGKQNSEPNFFQCQTL